MEQILTAASQSIYLSTSVVLWLLSALLWLLALLHSVGLFQASSRQTVAPGRVKSRYYFKGRRASDSGQTVSKMRYATATLALISLTENSRSFVRSGDNLKRRNQEALELVGETAGRVVFK